MLSRRPRSKMLELCDEWNVSERTMDSYIAKAKDMLLEMNKATAQEDLAVAVHHVMDIMEDAKIENDLKTRLAAVMAFAKLKGLDQTTIKHVVGQGSREDMSTIPDEDLDDIIEAEFK